MNKALFKYLLLLLIASSPAMATELNADVMKVVATQAQFLAESRNTAQTFMQTLGGALKKQLELGGAESAIGVCKQIAPALASEYSKNDRVVKRVSLKSRNVTQGTPDAWEKNVLEQFDINQQAGKPLANIEVSTLTEEADGHWYRYMKAIPTQAMCLQCHGKPADISAGVRALLLQEYPQDKAIGYSVGEVRGAISIKRLASKPTATPVTH